jgi:exodeoxyribonuclease VII large subunit
MAMKPIKVSQVNSYIKRILQTDPVLSNISVSGEISNIKFHGAGNVYFTLKDDTSKLNCYLSADFLKNIHYDLVDGLSIIASGNIFLYERGGTYSLNVKEVAIEGIGNLSIAYEKLKEKLKKEGYFDTSHKKTLPAFPKTIAVVTSETGAAIQDIIKTIRMRNNVVDIVIFPCLVQGNTAAAIIARMIDDINLRFKDTDVIIIGRGGGSIEELWAFNEEIVAKAIFLSEIPIISGVGHETDFTIADFVADIRAATPTAAAQLAVPETIQLQFYLDDLAIQLKNALEQRIRLFETRLAARNMTSLRAYLLAGVEFKMLSLNGLIDSTYQGLKHCISKKEGHIDVLLAKINGLSPINIMKSGYGAIQDSTGRFIQSAKDTHQGQDISVRLKDGLLACFINQIKIEE